MNTQQRIEELITEWENRKLIISEVKENISRDAYVTLFSVIEKFIADLRSIPTPAANVSKEDIVAAFNAGSAECEAYWCNEPLLYEGKAEVYYNKIHNIESSPATEQGKDELRKVIADNTISSNDELRILNAIENYCKLNATSSPSPITEQDAGEWISVNDKLPELGNEVNVLTIDSLVTSLARFIRNEDSPHFYYWDNHYPGKGNMHLPESVTHWQPLPSIPPSNKPL